MDKLLEPVMEELFGFKHNKLICTPIILEKVCATGQKCFHDIHYLFESDNGNDIPADACPINCVATNLQIVGVDVPVPPGGFPPRRVGDCIVFVVRYTVRVFYEFINPNTNELDVGIAIGHFSRELAVPVEDIAGGCFLCEPEETNICVRTLLFDCIRAVLVPRPSGFPSNFPPFAIAVTVEKEFFVLQSGRSIVSIPAFKYPCIELPFPPLPAECVPFEKPAQCSSYCEETDLDPGRCAQCPPPQP